MGGDGDPNYSEVEIESAREDYKTKKKNRVNKKLANPNESIGKTTE